MTNVLVNVAKGFAKERLFGRMLRNMNVEPLLVNKKEDGSRRAFCIVHWNAPHFLLLNVKRLELLHPESKIYIFDNASSEANLKTALSELRDCENVTLFSSKRDYSNTWACHIMGLQFLLNYAAQKSDSTVTFLDQDCILANRIDDLADQLDGRETLLIGVRDYVEIPHDYGPLKKGTLRNFPDVVHGSFMMMQPLVIHNLFGDQSLIDGRSFEPYHGIARKAAGKILFLETQMHAEIPLLTRYTYRGKTYAWHSWYSSRTVGMKDTDFLNGLPVSWLKDSLRKAYAFMEHLPAE
ncbi:hypothetical protein MUP38_00135 [Candidatus Bathyarchaeota archaeon]|nr:hypothetical protein [Candidatus Bathyarchaeota archaeon]